MFISLYEEKKCALFSEVTDMSECRGRKTSRRSFTPRWVQFKFSHFCLWFLEKQSNPPNLWIKWMLNFVCRENIIQVFLSKCFLDKKSVIFMELYIFQVCTFVMDTSNLTEFNKTSGKIFLLCFFFLSRCIKESKYSKHKPACFIFVC